VAFRGQRFGDCRWVICRPRVIPPESLSVNVILCKVASAAFRAEPTTEGALPGAQRKKPGNMTPALLFHPHMHGRVFVRKFAITNFRFAEDRLAESANRPTQLADRGMYSLYKATNLPT